MTVTTPLGQVLRDDEGVRLEFVRTYTDPIEDVWSALTESERVARWFGRWTGDPTTGTVDFVMIEAPDADPQPVEILECEPPTDLVVKMHSPDGTWTLAVRLRVEAGTTTLVFTQRLAEPYDPTSIGPGWHYYLDRLAAVVAGTPLPDVWDDYYPVLADSYRLPD
jgi:uncharacterized protein YndB with AHSA1/START domain